MKKPLLQKTNCEKSTITKDKLQHKYAQDGSFAGPLMIIDKPGLP